MADPDMAIDPFETALNPSPAPAAGGSMFGDMAGLSNGAIGQNADKTARATTAPVSVVTPMSVQQPLAPTTSATQPPTSNPVSQALDVQNITQAAKESLQRENARNAQNAQQPQPGAQGAGNAIPKNIEGQVQGAVGQGIQRETGAPVLRGGREVPRREVEPQGQAAVEPSSVTPEKRAALKTLFGWTDAQIDAAEKAGGQEHPPKTPEKPVSTDASAGATHGFTYAVDEAERAAAGMKPRERPVFDTPESQIAEASRVLQTNRPRITALVNEMAETGRAPNTLEEKSLLQVEVVKRRQEREAARRNLDAQTQPGPARDAAKAAYDNAVDEAQKAWDVWLRGSSLSGAMLQASQRMIAEDYSLENITHDYEAIAGRKLDKSNSDDAKILEKIRKTADAIADARAKAEDVTKANEGQRKEEIESGARKAADEQRRKVSEEEKNRLEELAQRGTAKPSEYIPPEVLKAAKKFIARINTTADAKWADVADEWKMFTGGAANEAVGETVKLSAKMLDALAWKGAGILTEGAYKGAEFADKLAHVIGENVRPYADQVYAAAQKILDAETKKEFGEAAKKVLRATRKQVADERTADEFIQQRKDELIAKRQEALDIIAEKQSNGEQDIGNQIKDVVNSVIDETPEIKHEPLFVEAQKILKDAGIHLTTDAIKEAYIDYNADMKALDKETIASRMREARRTTRLDLTAGDVGIGVLPRRVRESDPLTDEQRALLSRRNEGLKKLFVDNPNHPEYMATVQQSIGTALKHRIADLDRAIKEKERIPSKTQPVDNEANAKLRAHKDELQRQYDSLFPKEELTGEEKLARATAAAESILRGLEDENARLKAGQGVNPRDVQKNSVTPDTKLLGIRARIDEARAIRDGLREQQFHLKDRAREESMQAASDKKNQMIKSGDVAFKEKNPQTPDTPKMQQLRKINNTLDAEIERIRDEKGITRERQIDRMIKAAERAEDRYHQEVLGLQEKNSSKKPGPWSQELDMAVSARDAAKQYAMDLRNAAKKTDDIAAMMEKLNSPDLGGEKIVKPTKEQSLQQQFLDGVKDELGKRLEAARDAAGLNDKAKEQAKIKALDVAIAKIQKQLDLDNFDKPQGKASVTSPAIDARQAALDALKDMRDDRLRYLNPPESPWAIYNRVQQAQIKRQEFSMMKRMVNNDFSVPEKKAPEFKANEETRKAQADLRRLEKAHDQQRMEWQDENRSWYDKWGRFFVRLERQMKLSSPVVFGKLGGAALARTAVQSPIEEAVNTFYAKIMPEVAKHAGVEGPMSAKAEAKAWAGVYKGVMEDAIQKLRTGQSYLDIMYGDAKHVDEGWLGFFGRIHGAIKAPVFRYAYERGLQKSIERSILRGENQSDPDVVLKNHTLAYNAGMRAIFMQKNFASNMFQNTIRGLEMSKHPAGPLTANVLRFLFPIVRVSSNIVGETGNMLAGTVIGGTKLIKRGIKGEKASQFTPEENDALVRNFTKGSLGLVLLGVGYAMPEMFGGYYQRNDKRSKDDVKAGRVRIGNTDLPAFATHNPMFEVMQFGATIRRISEQKYRNGDTRGIGEGVFEASKGLAKEVPFFDEPYRITHALDSTEGAVGYAGELAASSIVPQLVSWAARMQDQDETGETVRRTPDKKASAMTQIGQRIEEDIPNIGVNQGFNRQNVSKAKEPKHRHQ